MKKSFLSLGCAVITVALGLFEQTSAAAIFPAQGDDTMSSMGVFRLMVAPAFRPLLAPAPPTFTSGYPGYRSADGRLTSPALLDSATTVGRSAPHDRVLAGSVPVGLPSMGNLGYADYPAIPALFASAPAPTREILTQIRSFALAALRDKCPPDPRVPTVPLNWVMVKAGPNQGVALNSIGMVQENVANGAADPDFPAKSFFDIFVEVSLPAVPGTVSSTVFPVTGASLYNDSPLIITNLNLSSLPPNVVYIHGETTAVPLKFKNNNPPYWNAGDVFGYLVLAGHGTQTDCSSESAFLDAVLGPIGTSRPELPIEWPFPNPLCPPTSSSYNSVRDVDIVNFGNVRVRNFIHTNLVNSIAPPPLNGSATYNAGNTLVTLEVSSDGGNTWSPAQANGQVAVGINHTSDSGNTGIFDTDMFQLNLNGNSPFGPFMIRESPTLQSLGKHTIRPSSPEYLVSGFFDVFLELSIDGGQTWIPANRSIRVQLTPPVTNPGIPIVVTCSADITVTATSAAGAVVTYSSSASGGCSPPVVNCNSPSGSTFPIGITTVTCTASDSCGNTARCNFKVTVRLPVEVDHFPNTTAQIILQKPGGGTEQVTLAGPSTVQVLIAPDGTGALDTDGNGREQVQTEMVAMNLVGNSSLGPVTIHLDPLHPTLGQIEEQVNNTPGKLDLPPFTPTGQADSFFDVFVQIEVAGRTLHPAAPLHMTAVIKHKPPGPGDQYVNPFTQPVPLLDAAGTPTGFSVLQEVHTPNPTNPPPVEVDHFPNTTAQIILQKPGGGTEQVTLAGPSTVQVLIAPDGTGALDTDGNGREQVQTEMVAMNLVGNSSLGPVTIHLDPLHPTLGQIEEQVNNTPGKLDLPPFTPTGQADSFFDVFVQIEVAGRTLHPATPLHMTSVIKHKPPGPGDQYVNPFTQPVPLLDAAGTPTGFSVLQEVHTPNPTNPPPVEVDHFPNTTAQIILQKPGGGTEQVTLAGPSTVQVLIAPDGTGALDTDGNGREQVQTEMVAMNLVGNSSLGPVTIHLDPLHPTLGQIEEQVNNTPGKLDLPPFTPTGQADSFFDVFVQIEVAGRTLHPATPLHMTAVIKHKPPGPGDQYVNPFTQPVPLLDATGTPTGFSVLQEVHTPNPTNPPPVEVDHFPNTTAQIILQKPGGGTEQVTLAGPSTVQVLIAPDGTGALDTDGNGREQVQTEMVAMNLVGNSSLGPVTIHLDPLHPTLGQIEEQVNNTPGKLDLPPFTPTGQADSFFDVFVQIEVAGRTLHPATPLHMTAVIKRKPPGPGDQYVNPFTQPVPLLDAAGTPTGFSVLQEVHTPNPAPIILSCSSNITVTAASANGAVVTYTSSASSTCPPVTVNCNPPSGSTFPIGTTTVTCTASDACGQTAKCTFTVNVNPPSPITLTCSSNITMAATSATGAVVTYTSSASGGCSPPPSVVCNPPSGSTFPIGTTTVTCTASDACGQTTNCTFTVTVVRPPVTIQVIGNQLRVIWSDGTLQESDKVEGPFIDVDPQPTSPLNVTPTDAKKFFRVRAGQPGSGFTFYDTEMLQLDISGGSLPAGMMLRESPTLASTGKTAISPAPGGGFVIDSFFDVFTELSMDGGQTWQVSTGAPPRMRFTGNAPTNTVPPREAQYVSPAQWHALYAQGIYITNASHLGFLGSFPPPPPGGVSDTHGFGSTVNMLVRPCPTCPYQPVSAPAQVTVRVTSRP